MDIIERIIVLSEDGSVEQKKDKIKRYVDSIKRRNVEDIYYEYLEDMFASEASEEDYDNAEEWYSSETASKEVEGFTASHFKSKAKKELGSDFIESIFLKLFFKKFDFLDV